MLDIGGGFIAQAKSFAKLAAEGSFSVNETGGEALLRAIQEMKDWIDSKEGRFGMLSQVMPLGSSHAAETIKPYMAEVASDQQGFITMLGEFRTSLDEAERGINAAMATYQEQESGIGSRFTQA